MKKHIAIIAASLTVLSGCEEAKYSKYEIDRNVQREIFKECMAALPAGPVATKYNDWDEVVEACRYSAAQMAYYCYENCPPKASTKSSGGEHG